MYMQKRRLGNIVLYDMTQQTAGMAATNNSDESFEDDFEDDFESDSSAGDVPLLEQMVNLQREQSKVGRSPYFLRGIV